PPDAYWTSCSLGSLLGVRGVAVDVLNHYKFRARLGGVDFHHIHERAYQENASSRCLHQVLRRQWIRNPAGVEPLTLIANDDHQVAIGAFKRKCNFLARVVGIAM